MACEEPVPGYLSSGEVVIRVRGTHRHAIPAELLARALEKIDSGGREFLIEEVRFPGEVIGQSSCVVTTAADDICFAHRPQRCGLTRFVMNRQCQDCDAVTVILAKHPHVELTYILVTAFIGHHGEAEPWDVGAFENDPRGSDAAQAASIAYWGRGSGTGAGHALVWGSEPVDTESTTECPW